MTGVLIRRGRVARDVHSDERPHKHTVRRKPSVSQGERSQENQTCSHLHLGFQPLKLLFFVVAQSFSCVQHFATPWTAARQAYLSFTISRTLLKLLSTVWFQRVRHNWVNEQQEQQYPPSWWGHQTISSTALPFSSCLLSFPASGSFPVSQHFTSGGQNIGASASVSVLPMNI